MQINRVILAAEMARKDINQKQLARQAGVCRQTIRRATRHPCKDQTARAVADALGVPLRDLVVL